MNIEEIKNTIIQGDCLEVLKTLPDESINCAITSPPYWALRDYGTSKWEGGKQDCDHIEPQGGQNPEKSGKQLSSAGTQIIQYKTVCKKCGAKRIDHQLGLEKTFDEYIKKLCGIFDEVKRVLKKDGTCWVNIGDTYGGSGGDSGKTIGNERKGTSGIDTRPVGIGGIKGNQEATKGLEKSLCLIPQRLVIEMVNRGWICRNTIIWYKRNCMPSSANDRFTVNFEYIYFFVKSKKYWFEQQFEPVQECSIKRLEKSNAPHEFNGSDHLVSPFDPEKGRNKRCVWDITTKAFHGSHFATFPEDLVIPMIKAGCPEFVCKKCGKARERILEREGLSSAELMKGKDKTKFQSEQGQKENIRAPREAFERPLKDLGYTDCGCGIGFDGGIVLDPFSGAGTTCMVAKKLNRNYVGIELNKSYIDMSLKRIEDECGTLL